MSVGDAAAVVIAKMKIDPLARAWIYAHAKSAARLVTGPEIGESNAGEHLLRRVIVAGQRVEKMIGVAISRGDVEQTS